MKENEIMRRAQRELDKEGKIWWIAVKRKGFAQQDIFGIFDIVYLQHENWTYPNAGTTAGFIQCTTKHNIAARRNKIRAYFKEKRIPVPARCFVWAFDSARNAFIKELIQ